MSAAHDNIGSASNRIFSPDRTSAGLLRYVRDGIQIGIAFQGVVKEVTLRDCKSGPCPKCGGTGHVPDGIYDFVGNVLSVLAAPERTIAELTRLREVLRRSQKMRESREGAATRVEREVPVFARIGEELRKAPIATTTAAVVLILTAIQTFLALRDSPKSPDVVVNTVINNYAATLPPTASGQKPHRSEKHPGRNEPCSCGSGKKYKRCCGAPNESSFNSPVP
jgi:hypothetical protein